MTATFPPYRAPDLPERQPGGRLPAPAPLELVQAFANTRWNLDTDHSDRWTSPAALAEWLAGRGLLDPAARLREADLDRALDVREGLRALMFANNHEPPDHDAIERLAGALGERGLFVRLAADAPPTFDARERDLETAFATIAAIVAVAQVDGSWLRLKACPGRDCGWAFYDHSRNQKGNWCSMSVCGSRTKAREYRRRNRGAGAR